MSRSKAEIDNFIASFRRKAKNEQEIQLRGYQFATFYWEAREYALAIQWAQSYLAVKHTDSRVYKLLGNLYEAVKDYGKAVDSYKKSLEFNETQKDLILRIASLGCTIPNFDVEKLRYWVERAERFYPSHTNIHKIKEHIFRRSGKLPDYEIYLRNKLVQRKGDYYLNCKLVKLLIEMHRLREAVDHILLTQDMESVADQPIWWESTVHTLEIYIKSIRQGEERTTSEDTIMEMHSHLLVALCKWIMLSLAIMDKPPHNAVVLLKGLDQCLLRANSLKVNTKWDCILDEMSSHLYYLMGLHLCRMAAMGSFRLADIIGLVTSCFIHSAQVKLPDMSGRPEYESKKWTLLASARLSEVSHMLHAFKKQYGPDWLEKCHRSTSNLQSQTHLFHVAFGQEADPNKSFFMSDTNFVKVQDIVLDDLVGVVLKYDQDAVLAQPHNLQLLVWLGLQWDVRKDGISPDLGTFIETSFDKLHFASNNLKITSVDNLRLLDIEAFLYILVKAAKTKRQAMLADGRTDPNQPTILPVPLCQMLFTEEQGKWFKSVCALYSGNAKSEERAKMRLSIQKGLEAIRNADKFNIDTSLLIHLAKTFRARMLEEKKENDVPDNEQFLACQRLSVHYWQAANEHLKMLASDKAVSPPKHAFFIPSQDKIKKEEIGSLLEEAAVALSEYEFQQGHHQQALNLLSKVKGVTGLFTKALMCKQLSKMEVEGKDDSQVTASMILKQGTYLDQCTYALYSAMDAIQDDHNNSMHEEIQGMLDEIDIEKQQLARKGLEESESLDTSRRFSSNTPSRLSLGKTPSRTPQDGRSSLTSIGDISFQQGLSPDPSPRRLLSELRTMNMSQTRLADENSQLRTLALSHSRLLEQNAEILSKHNDVMDQNRFLMEQIINLNKELQELKLNTPPPAHLSKSQAPTSSQSGNDSSIINTEKSIVINANNCRIEHAEASNLTAPQPVMYYPTHPPMFPQPLLPGYNLPGLSFSGLPTADAQYMPSMMASTPAPHYHNEDAYETEGKAYTIDPHLTIPSLKLLDPKGLSTPTHPGAQSRTSENPAESTRIDEGFTGFSGLGTIHPKTFLQTGTTAGLSPVAPSGSPGLQSSIYQQKLNMQPLSSPVGSSLNKGEPAPEKLASDAPLLRKILIGSEEDPVAPQTVPTFPSLSSNSRFGAGDKSSERSAVSPNFTSGTRLGSAKAKEPEPTKGFTPTFSFGNKPEAIANQPVKTTAPFSGFSFGSGNIFTPVSGHQPVQTSSSQFSKPVFGEPQPASTSQVGSPFSQSSTGMKGLNFTTSKESTSPFTGLGLGTQKPSPTMVAPQPIGGSLSAGQEATVSSSTSQTKEDDDVICIYERKPTPAQIAMALKLKLPPTFYLYEYKEPCKGCIGCQEDLNLAMLFNKENRISREIPSAQTSSQAIEAQASKEAVSTTPFMFGGSTSSSMTFASLSTSNQSTPDFMKQNASQKFSWANAGTQLFSSSGGGGGEDDYDPHYEPIVTLPEITDLKTGEEDETCLWKERAKLYRFNKEVNQWKERGVGDVKFMHNKNTGRVRILMRRDQVLKVCANHMITADLEIKVMQSSDRAWVWSALDFSEGEAKMEQLAIKFKKPEMASEFKEKFEEAKQLVIEADKKGSAKKIDEKQEEPKEESFADKFKPKPGTWTCDTCLVTNPPDTVKCLACATLKPGATPPVAASKSSEPVVASGGFKFGGTISSPPTSGFSFGGPSVGANAKPQAGGFSFGGDASTTTGGQTQPSGFSFGKAASAATDGQTQPSGFSFGKAASATTGGQTQPSGFSFGKAASAATDGQTQPSGFSFGASASAATDGKPQPTGFSFGKASSAATAGQTQSSGFTFGKTGGSGSAAAENATSKPTGFTFGQPVSGTQSETSAFSFGNSKPTGASGLSLDGNSSKASSTTQQQNTSPATTTDDDKSLTCQPGVQPEASSVSSTTPSRFQFGSSKQESATPTSPSKTFSFGTTGKALPQFSFGGGEEKSATSVPSASTGFTFAAKPSSGGFMFGSNLNQNASEEQALDLSSPKKTGSPSCKFSDISKTFTFQFKMDPEEAANAPPKSPTKSPGIQRSPGFIRSPSLDRSAGDDSYCKDDDGDGLHFEPVVQLEPVELTTGEENEEVMFCHRAKMYRFNKETNEWKERGMGDIKILKHKETGLYRLLMRREQVLKLCANHFILPEIVLKPNSGSDRSWVWTAIDASDDGEVKSELLAVRFKAADVAVEFKEAFENAKEAVKKIKCNDGGEKSVGNVSQEVKEGNMKEENEDEADKGQEGDNGQEEEENGEQDEEEEDDEQEDEEEQEDDEEEETEKVEEKVEEGAVKDTPADAPAPQVTFKFGMDFAAAVRKTMSEDEKTKTPISILKPEASPEKSSLKSSDQGYYPEEERDDLQFKPIVTLAEVEVKTGEEDEEQLFCQRAKMYRWNRAESQWKERGVGEIKILKHKVLNRSRVLMRRDQVLKICANHIITPEMELKPNAGSDRSLVWNAIDASDDEPSLEQLAVRFKTADITAEFKSVFEKCQSS